MLTLTPSQAQRFLLAQQFLWPPRSLQGKQGILQLMQRLGCIQYDPVNIVGPNPHLVLQARLQDYSPTLLNELLYHDRLLWDGWDKVMSIYSTTDWPYFARRRAIMRQHYAQPDQAGMRLADFVRQNLRQRGPLSSIDIQNQERADWFWGPTRLVRSTLEALYFSGEIGIHHRIGTRRFFDRIENLLSAELLQMPDPFPTLEAYHDWHVLRRIGSLGLAHPGAGEHWGGILECKSAQRQAAIKRLLQQGLIQAVQIIGLPQHAFYLRNADLPLLEDLQPVEPCVSFLAPLDNLLWDRQRLRLLFNFDYIWEVYKPPAQRKYGHYTLPVLYGDQFVARFEPSLNRKTGRLTIQNWWWEADQQHPSSPLQQAIAQALQAFAAYLQASSIELAPSISLPGL
ncbi:MAG: YcaQ family DNA glycosylase [Longilinea sp.]|nr:YcaQ family DNA glycosylase [Longilinea sp.]